MAEEVKNALTITPVHDVAEVLAALELGPKKPALRQRSRKSSPRAETLSA